MHEAMVCTVYANTHFTSILTTSHTYLPHSPPPTHTSHTHHLPHTPTTHTSHTYHLPHTPTTHTSHTHHLPHTPPTHTSHTPSQYSWFCSHYLYWVEFWHSFFYDNSRRKTSWNRKEVSCVLVIMQRSRSELVGSRGNSLDKVRRWSTPLMDLKVYSSWVGLGTEGAPVL